MEAARTLLKTYLAERKPWSWGPGTRTAATVATGQPPPQAARPGPAVAPRAARPSGPFKSRGGPAAEFLQSESGIGAGTGRSEPEHREEEPQGLRGAGCRSTSVHRRFAGALFRPVAIPALERLGRKNFSTSKKPLPNDYFVVLNQDGKDKGREREKAAALSKCVTV